MKTQSLVTLLGILLFGLCLSTIEGVSGYCISGGGSCDSKTEVGCCKNFWCNDGTCVGYLKY